MEPVRKSSSTKAQDTNTRISILETTVNHVSSNVEKLEQKIDSNYATLHSRISDLRDDLRSDFELKNEKILQKLEEHNKSSIEHSEALNQRLSEIEKWKWMIMGAAVVLGFILAHINLGNLF
jgi:predicted RNase H-like nuclease (RuvC/YqgF family)